MLLPVLRLFCKQLEKWVHTGAGAVSLCRHKLSDTHHEQRVNTQPQVLQQKILRCPAGCDRFALMCIQETLASKASRKEQFFFNC